MTDFTENFVNESRDGINEMNSGLFDLEQNPDDRETLDKVFRVAHTIKGNAGAVGFDQIGNLAHAMEDVLDEIRAGNVEVDQEVMDALFDGLDRIEEMVDEADEHGEPQSELDGEIETIRSFVPDEEDAESESESTDTEDEGESGTDEPTEDKITRPEDCHEITEDGTQCEITPPEGEKYCHIHRDDHEDEGGNEIEPVSEETIEDLADEVDADGDVDQFYHLRISVSNSDPEEVDGETALDALHDAFTVHTTQPEHDNIESGDYEHSFDAIIGCPVGVGFIESALGSVEHVDDAYVEDITEYVDLPDSDSTGFDFGGDDTTDSEDTEQSDTSAEEKGEDDPDVDSLLDEASEFDDIDNIDEDEVADVDVEIDEDASGGTFDTGSESDAESEDDGVSEGDDELGFGDDDDFDLEGDEGGDDDFDLEGDDDFDLGGDDDSDSEDGDMEFDLGGGDDLTDDESDDEDDMSSLAEIDNEGAQKFAELATEEDEADDFSEVEQEMEETDFDFGDDDDEVGFDDLLGDDADDADVGGDDGDFDLEDDGDFDLGGDEGGDDDFNLEDDGDDFNLEGDDESEPEVESESETDDELQSGEDTVDELIGDDDSFDHDVESPDLSEDSGSVDDLEDEGDMEDFEMDDSGTSFEDLASDDEPDPDEFSDENIGLGDSGVSDDTAEAESDDATSDAQSETDSEDEDESIFGTDAGVDDMAGDDDELADDDAGEVFDVDDGGVGFGSAFDSDDGLDDFDELLREADQEAGVNTASESDLDISSVRVDIDQLDEMYTLVQELITNRIRLKHAIDGLEDADADDVEAIEQAYDEVDELETITGRLQDTVMDVRLVTLEHATQRLPRVVRDVARDHDKKVDFNVEGENVELDRGILAQLNDPLMHLVRNAVDHGIEDPETRKERGKDETGTVEVSARRSRDRVTITVQDDGAGINADRIRREAVEEGLMTEEQAAQMSDEQAYELIFRPGFTTKEEVSETSGRGVGMDVVYDAIRSVDGSVSVQSEEGEGTRVRIRVPVSLAILQVLLVNVGGETYGVPLKSVDKIDRVNNIEEIDGEETHLHDGDTYPVVRLDDAFDLDTDGIDDESGRLIRVDTSARKMALLCDSVSSQEEVVVEPYDGVLSTIPGFSGAAVLGEGDVVNIIDVDTL